MYKSNDNGGAKKGGKGAGRYTFGGSSPAKGGSAGKGKDSPRYRSDRPDKPKFGDKDWRDKRYPDRAPRHSESNSRVSSRFEADEDRVESGAIVGRNAVIELLKSGRDVDKLFVLKPQGGEKPTGSIVMIVAMAVERKIPVVEVERSKLDDLADGVPHQGVAAMVPEREYSSLDDIFDLAASRGEKPLIVIADDISDPHNLGAIIRSAEGAGAHGVIIPKRRSASVTPVVAKASAGASSWLPIVKAANLSQTVDALKERGVWIYAADAGGVGYTSLDYDVPAALIVGNEGDGISRLLLEKSDFIVSLPMRGQVSSLNVSCAAAVLLYKMTEGRSPAASGGGPYGEAFEFDFGEAEADFDGADISGIDGE
ncbi:MAG: 23S rRNA (guanosine(2251)-2'-O)-methyltransferase RlmB [Clostridiales bacterium]|nr:23S rRNA (guanosine(2251)-2'-O)-methyltransferase RlmB [Clostridiales bacterium]